MEPLPVLQLLAWILALGCNSANCAVNTGEMIHSERHSSTPLLIIHYLKVLILVLCLYFHNSIEKVLNCPWTSEYAWWLESSSSAPCCQKSLNHFTVKSWCMSEIKLIMEAYHTFGEVWGCDCATKVWATGNLKINNLVKLFFASANAICMCHCILLPVVTLWLVLFSHCDFVCVYVCFYWETVQIQFRLMTS